MPTFLTLFVLLFYSSLSFSASHRLPCDWTFISKYTVPKDGIATPDGQVILGEGIGGGRVYRETAKDGQTRTWKVYRDSYRAKKDQLLLEILQKIRSKIFSIIFSRLSDSSTMEIEDYVYGETVEKIYLNLKMHHQERAELFKQEWVSMLEAFATEIEDFFQTEGKQFDTKVLPATYITMLPLLKIEYNEYYFNIHAKNVVIDWNHRKAWIIDPY